MTHSPCVSGAALKALTAWILDTDILLQAGKDGANIRTLLLLVSMALLLPLIIPPLRHLATLMLADMITMIFCSEIATIILSRLLVKCF